jgi:hypothetical protein
MRLSTFTMSPCSVCVCLCCYEFHPFGSTHTPHARTLTGSLAPTLTRTLVEGMHTRAHVNERTSQLRSDSSLHLDAPCPLKSIAKTRQCVCRHKNHSFLQIIRMQIRRRPNSKEARTLRILVQRAQLQAPCPAPCKHTCNPKPSENM